MRSKTVDRKDPIARLLLRLKARAEISAEEETALRDAISEVVTIGASRTLIKAGVEVKQSTLLIDGFACRYKDLADGQRQMPELHVPGDFLDLHSFLLKRLEHHVGSLTPVTLAHAPHAALRDITERFPHLARALWFATLVDASIHRERILTVGRRSAMARIGHLLCELNARLEVVGLSDGHQFALPITQTDVADATGLTAVHVNRMLRQLRDQGLVTYRGGQVIIHDRDRLWRLAEFSPAYLYLDHRSV